MTITERMKHLVKKSPRSDNFDELFLPKEIFRKIIDRERDRANRTGEVFSLVVFVLPDNGEQKNVLELLACTLSPRVRSIDAVGWLDLKHLGILLPETNSDGAHMFARKICLEINTLKSTLSYEVFIYPSDKLTDPQKNPLRVLSGKSDHKLNRVSVRHGRLSSKTQQNVDYIFCLSKRLLKRGFDVIGASVFLVIFSPVFLAVAALIKTVSPGPVFFKQQRIGYGGQPFTFLKFRTMRLNAETQEHQDYLASLINGASDENKSDVPMLKLDNDPQIIPCGNLLRKSCLDELPQLINVLRGDMSLVGPRPPIPYEVKEYHSWHRGRFNALPGMTGLWQVSGKNKLSFKEMVRLDIRYSKNRSLWVDIKILLRTPLAIFDQVSDSLKRKKTTIEEGV